MITTNIIKTRHCVEDRFIKVEITKELLDYNDEYTEQNPINNSRSVLDGEGANAGYLGEFVFESVFHPLVSRNNTYWCDFNINLKSNGEDVIKTVDIKTKSGYMPPQVHRNECSVTDDAKVGLPDYYVFIWLERGKGHPYHQAWIGGIVRQEFYYAKAKKYEVGDVGDNGYIYKNRKYNLDMSLTSPMIKLYNTIYT